MRVLVSPFSNVTATSVRSKYDRGHVPLFPTFKGCQCSRDTRINILCTHGCNVFSTLLYVHTACLFLTLFATTMAAEDGGRAVVLELIKMGVRRGTDSGIRMEYMSAGTEIVASHASSSCTSSLSLTRQEISGAAGYNIVIPSSKIFRSCELRSNYEEFNLGG
jgi:hypothetical protein